MLPHKVYDTELHENYNTSFYMKGTNQFHKYPSSISHTQIQRKGLTGKSLSFMHTQRTCMNTFLSQSEPKNTYEHTDTAK